MRELWKAPRRSSQAAGVMVLLSLLTVEPSRAGEAQDVDQSLAADALTVDRVVVRFTAPEIGGAKRPRFIYERVLSFEARLEALADVTFAPTQELPYRDVHLRSALERHVAETILESLQVVPALSTEEIQERVQAARVSEAMRVGGAQALSAAAREDGLEPREVLRVMQRKARASLYLDRMVAPMLQPSAAELQSLHQSGRTPFSRDPYEVIEEELERWYVARKLREAVLSYYEGARARVELVVVAD
jgi:hypothetical protein